jgi:hypothetical protein
MSSRKRVVLASSVCLIFAAVITIRAQQSAAVQMVPSGSAVESGKPLVLEIKLDKPLPADTSVIARVRPEDVSQLIVLSSSTPDDPSRTKITLKTILPTPVVPGKWKLEDVFIDLPGSNNWQPLEHNVLKFDVQGKPFPIPSRADVTLAQ